MALRLEVPGVIVDEIQATIGIVLFHERRNAFEAARETHEKATGYLEYFNGDNGYFNPPKFKTYDDYLNHIKTKQNESSTGKTQIDPGP
jgi:hypothetical protein